MQVFRIRFYNFTFSLLTIRSKSSIFLNFSYNLNDLLINYCELKYKKTYFIFEFRLYLGNSNVGTTEYVGPVMSLDDEKTVHTESKMGLIVPFEVMKKLIDGDKLNIEIEIIVLIRNPMSLEKQVDIESNDTNPEPMKKKTKIEKP